MGNCTRLSQIIAEGHLDFYLALPKRPTPCSRESYERKCLGRCGIWTHRLRLQWCCVIEHRHALRHSILAAVIFVSFAVLAHSLTFFIGNANALAGQMFNALITFSLLSWRGSSRVCCCLMFTAIPAGFMYAPVGILGERKLDFVLAMGLLQLSSGSFGDSGIL